MPLRRCRRETKEQCTRVEVQTTARERREKSEPPASTAQDCCRAYLLVVEEVVAVPLANTLLSETRCRDEVKRCQQEVCAAKYRKYPSTPPRWFPIFVLHPPLPFSKCVLEGRGSIRRFKKFNSSSGVETEIGSGRESQKEIDSKREREREIMPRIFSRRARAFSFSKCMRRPVVRYTRPRPRHPLAGDKTSRIVVLLAFRQMSKRTKDPFLSQELLPREVQVMIAAEWRPRQLLAGMMLLLVGTPTRRHRRRCQLSR